MSNSRQARRGLASSGIGAAGAGRTVPVHGCALEVGVLVHGFRHSAGHRAGFACRWPPCGCTTTTGSPMPIRPSRPWPGATRRFRCPVRASRRVGMRTPHAAASGSLRLQRSLAGRPWGRRMSRAAPPDAESSAEWGRRTPPRPPCCARAPSLALSPDRRNARGAVPAAPAPVPRPSGRPLSVPPAGASTILRPPPKPGRRSGSTRLRGGHSYFALPPDISIPV